MFSESFRGQCTIYADPLAFEGKVLELVKEFLNEKPYGMFHSFIQDSFRLEDEGQYKPVQNYGFDHIPTIDEALANIELATALYECCGIDAVTVYEAGCGDDFEDIVNEGLCSGGDHPLGTHDGKTYFLIQGD